MRSNKNKVSLIFEFGQYVMQDFAQIKFKN